jgi:hypothetical protein
MASSAACRLPELEAEETSVRMTPNDANKAPRDAAQAALVQTLVHEYLPNLLQGHEAHERNGPFKLSSSRCGHVVTLGSRITTASDCERVENR